MTIWYAFSLLEWKCFYFDSHFNWSLFLRSQLAISEYCLRWWLGAEQAPSHYLMQCWPSSLTHISTLSVLTYGCHAIYGMTFWRKLPEFQLNISLMSFFAFGQIGLPLDTQQSIIRPSNHRDNRIDNRILNSQITSRIFLTFRRQCHVWIHRVCFWNNFDFKHIMFFLWNPNPRNGGWK